MNRVLARRVGIALAILLAAFASRLILHAWTTPAVGTWAGIGAVADARAGAASVTLPDGRTLIAGGVRDGSVTDSVVIYNPAANAFAAAGQLIAARVGHTATLLEDGRVLVAGGTVDGLISSDIEIFDPASGTSALVAVMTQPRTGHAAAALADDTVLIVGGTTVDGLVLQSAELFEHASGSVTPLWSSLAEPRTGASATTLIDGRVLVAGGNDGVRDLATAEVYGAMSQSFMPATTGLSVARSGHTAVLLPHNNSVLVAGGTSNGVPRSVTDLFLPALFPDPYSYGMGTFATTGALGSARTGAVGGPTNVEGHAFAAGGGPATAEVYRFATIKTDKDDYAPGEFAVITGSGWQPGEVVRLVFQEDPAVHPDYVIDPDVVANANGEIYWDQWAPEQHDLGVRFYLMAIGSESGQRAQTTFTDSAKVTITSPTFAWHRTGEVAGGFNVSVQGTYSCDLTGADCTSVTNLTITVSGGVTGSKVITGLSTGTTDAAWGPVTLEFRTAPGAGQFTIPSPDGKFNVTATLDTNLADQTDTENNFFGVDNTAPVTDIHCDGDNPCANPYDEDVSVKLFEDDGNPNTSSGVDSTVYCVDTTNTCVPGTAYPGGPGFDVSYDAGATYYVRYRSTDKVGNVESINSQPIVFAAANATTSTSVASNNNPSTYGESVTFTATVTSTSTPTGSVNFVIDSGSPVAGTAGATTATTATWTYTTSALSAGTHTVSADFVPTGSFQNSSGSLSGGQVVDPLAVTLTGTRIYDGTTAAAFGILTVSNEVSGDDVTVASGTATLASKNVGTQAITSVGDLMLGGADAGNYTLTGATGSVEITALAVTLEGTRPYDGTTDAAFGILTVSNAIGLDVVTVVSGTATLASKDVGVRAITSMGDLMLGGADGGNYTLIGATGSVEITVLAVTLTGTRPYDGTTDAVAAILTVSNKVGTEDVTVASGTATLASKDVGTQAITSMGDLALGGVDKDNYTLTGATGSVEITALAVTLEGTRTYDGTTDAAAAILTVSNAVGTEDVTVASGTATLASKDVGTQAITSMGDLALGGVDKDNYTLIGATGSVEITPLAVTLEGTRTYDGTTDAAFGILTVSNAIGLDDVTVASGTATLASKDVGVRAITSMGDLMLGGADGGNYTLIGATGSVEITPLAVTLTGERTYDATTDAAFGILTVSNAIDPDEVTVASGTATLASKDVGVRAITSMGDLALGGADKDNYTLTGATGSVEITQAPLTITADANVLTAAVDPFTKVFDGLVYSGFTVRYDAFVGGEGPGDLFGTLTFTGPGTTATLPGVYVVTPAGLTSTNYLIEFESGSLTIGYGPCSAGYGPGGVILQPINSDGSSVYNRKGGSTIPVKFTVCDASGNPISDPAAVFPVPPVGSITMLNAVRGTVSVVNEPGISDIPDMGFRWAGDKWIFNMATANLQAGTTYTFRINLALASSSIVFRVGVK